MNDLRNALKILAQDTINAEKPVEVTFGSVKETEPLKIETEQRLVLTEEFIVVSENLKEKTVQAFFDDRSVKMKIDNSLKEGDTVIMLRQRGGQKYIVIDRE